MEVAPEVRGCKIFEDLVRLVLDPEEHILDLAGQLERRSLEAPRRLALRSGDNYVVEVET